MAISHVIITCTDEDLNVFDGYEFDVKTDYDEMFNDGGCGVFSKRYISFIVKDKTDLIKICGFINSLATHIHSGVVTVEWHNKLENAWISLDTGHTKFVRGKVNALSIDSDISNDLIKIKEILRKY
jgi:hypothetical protein